MELNKVGDINNDGLMDFIVGNYGLNSKYMASEDNPLSIVYGDFNDDGSYELIESICENGILVPIRQFNDLVKFVHFCMIIFKVLINTVLRAWRMFQETKMLKFCGSIL